MKRTNPDGSVTPLTMPSHSRLKSPTLRAIFHGVGMVTGKTDSPHLQVESVAAELFFGFASDDPLVPIDVIPTLRDVLKRYDVSHLIKVYPNTRHGFSFPSRDVYSETAAEACWDHMLGLFARRL